MTPTLWSHVFDVALCTLVLRIILGWLWIYPRLIRLLAVLLVLGAVVMVIYYFDLPLAGLLLLLLGLPITVILFLSFLPELSRIYQTASRGNLFAGRTVHTEAIVPELAKTLEQLAEERKGALIVFPGRTDAEDLISGGEEVDCGVKRSLLRSIFDPHCPRHDGAVVIRSGRVVRIGGVLPLASADSADGNLGTRHLAALGLSERCDADVFVVSEERGVVSHAKEGVLRELVPGTRDNLEEELSEIFGLGRKQQEDAKKFDRRSLGLWGVAMIMAAFGSYQVQAIKDQYFQAPTSLTSVEARVEFLNLPQDFYVDDLSATSCRMFLRAPGNLDVGRNYTIAVNVANQPAGALVLNLSPEMVRALPKDVQVERFEPSTVSFVLSKVRQMDISIEPGEMAGLKKGLKVGKVEIQPSKIKANVRDSSWKENAKIKTLPVDLNSIEEAGTYNIQIGLNLPASIEPLSNGGRKLVNIRVEVVGKVLAE